ncbi:MAG: UDP-2,3-diacylglucosamine diphosphatase [bacterium]
MSRILFISDAHLGFLKEEAEKQREKRFHEFIEYFGKSDTDLYIVGDLFDFWFEYRSVIPRRYFRVVSDLKALTERGKRVEYIIGNHDFGIDSFFEKELGIRVHRKAIIIEIDGKRLFVSHGDGLAKKDVGYRILKKILQNPFNIRLYRLLHPDAAFALALFCSKLSRNQREIKNRDEEYIQYARERFAEGFDGVVLAHTHRPQEFRETGSTYINLGDWMEHFTYGKFENGRLSLEYWNPQPHLNKEEQ